MGSGKRVLCAFVLVVLVPGLGCGASVPNLAEARRRGEEAIVEIRRSPGGKRVAGEVDRIEALSLSLPYPQPLGLTYLYLSSARTLLKIGSPRLARKILRETEGYLRYVAESVRAHKERGGKCEIFLVPGVHVDMGWTDPAPRAEEKQCQALLLALQTMERHPEYRFTLESAYVLKRFLKEHPERRGEVARRLREGKLEVASSWVLPHIMGFGPE
ncbi:MAG: hypothetical protein DRN06_06440, partial [Thermoprotei archaeon]